jgi:hypothetical protein
MISKADIGVLEVSCRTGGASHWPLAGGLDEHPCGLLAASTVRPNTIRRLTCRSRCRTRETLI